MWQPLVVGTVAERARRCMNRIAHALKSCEPERLLDSEAAAHYRPGSALDDRAQLRQVSLSEGVAGVALFAARWGGRDSAWTHALLDHALAVGSAAQAPPTLFGGFLGIALALDDVTRPALGGDDDTNDDVDEAVLEFVRARSYEAMYELVSGLVGAGVYALERMPRPSAVAILEELLEALAELAERPAPNRMAWRSEARTFEALTGQADPSVAGGYYNLGVAHGIAGVLSLLGSIARTPCRAGAVEMLSSAVPWFLEQEVADRDRPYGGAITQTQVLFYGRHGWCYGDLGKGLALLNAASAAGDAAWHDSAKRLLYRCARESGSVVEQLDDIGICHGTAGYAHLFHRAYRATGDDQFAEAARFWLELTLDRVEQREPERWWDDASLMTGGAGIGLVLHAACDVAPPTWDRLLLIGEGSDPW